MIKTWEERKRELARERAVWNCLYWGRRLEQVDNSEWCNEYKEILRNTAREQATHYAIRGCA